MASPLVVRVAGLPVAVLTRLRCAASFALACEIARLRARLAAEGAALSNELYDTVGALGCGAEKSAVVGLRRAVFTMRKPTRREWNDRVRAVLPADVLRLMTSWLVALRASKRLSDRLADAMQGRIASKVSDDAAASLQLTPEQRDKLRSVLRERLAEEVRTDLADRLADRVADEMQTRTVGQSR